MTQEMVGDGAGWQPLPIGEGAVMFAHPATPKHVVAGVLLAEIARRDKTLYDEVVLQALRERLPGLFQKQAFEWYYDLRADNVQVTPLQAVEIPISLAAIWHDLLTFAGAPLPPLVSAWATANTAVTLCQAALVETEPDDDEPPPAIPGAQPIPKAAEEFRARES